MGVDDHYGYWRVVEAFDKDETAGSFLREDGEGGFASGVYRMAAEIAFLRAELAERDARIAGLREAVNVSTEYGTGVKAAYLEGFEDGWDSHLRDFASFDGAQAQGWEDSWMARALAALSTPEGDSTDE